MVALEVAAADVLLLEVQQGAAHPEAVTPLGVAHFVEFPAPAARALVGDPDTLDLVGRDGGEVDIQVDAGGRRVFEELLQNQVCVIRDGGEVSIRFVAGERKPDGRKSVEGAFRGGADRARVGRRGGGVRSVVDARDHQVGPAALRFKDAHSHLDAVDRRAAEREEAVARFFLQFIEIQVGE